MAVCPACGARGAADERFCAACGARLYAQGRQPGNERTAVAVLLCDLVGRTPDEPWDAEDVDHLRRRFSSMSREIVTRFGGVVETYAGDAVLAVFGFPTARDDDAERAVRAAFDLVDEASTLRWPDGKPVQAGAAVNAGEDYPRLDVDSASGQSLPTGDVVNTAARLLAQAPPGGVWIAGPAHELTKDVARYQCGLSLELKGRGEPATAWRATGVTAVTGQRRVSTPRPGPFVGRRAELDALQAALDEASTERLSRFVLVVGEPGIGKTRLLNEFGARVTSAAGADDAARGVRWFRGDCRPFGGGVTLSALEDVVRAHAGISGDEDAVAREARLAAAVPEGPDAAWIRARLRPLVGLPGETAGREEDFAAWRAHLGTMVDGGRLVLVIEDLHWADEPMLAFLDTLATEPLHAPILFLASARPELLTRDDTALARDGGLRRLRVPPLTEPETQELLAALLGGGPPAGLDAALRQAAGDPLYAEAYVRLLADRGLIVRGRTGLAVADTPVPPPPTLQAVLTARLDTLPPAQKALLQDAAVLGECFWRDAAAALSERGDKDLDRMLGQLAERQLIRRRARGAAAIEGQPEFAFCHVLARDVAYDELPTLALACKHRAAAAWLEHATGDGVEDLAEIVAHHHVTAHELALAAGDEELATATLDPALTSLETAGRRGMLVDMAAGARHFRRGLGLAPADSPRRPRLLQGLGVALAGMSASRQAADVLREAVAEATAAGQQRIAAVAGVFLSGVLAVLLDEGHYQAMMGARALLRDADPSPEKVQALRISAAYHCNVVAEWQAAIDAADEAIAAAEQLGIAPPMGALAYRGQARCRLGDPRGRGDIERALAEGTDAGHGDRDIVEREYALCLYWTQGPVAALRRSGEAFGAAERRGARSALPGLRGDRVAYLSALGEWDAAAEQAAELSTQLEAIDDQWDLIPVRAQHALLLARRGSVEAALPLAARLREVGRRMPVQSRRSYCLLGAAIVHGLAGDGEAADELVTEWVRGWTGNDPSHAELLPDAVRLAAGCADVRWLGEPLGAVLRDLPIYGLVLDTIAAVRAERAGRYEAALKGYSGLTQRWRAFGAPYEQGQALLGAARCLIALERELQASPLLERARELFAGLRARPALAEVDALRARPAPGVARVAGSQGATKQGDSAAVRSRPSGGG